MHRFFCYRQSRDHKQNILAHLSGHILPLEDCQSLDLVQLFLWQLQQLFVHGFFIAFHEVFDGKKDNSNPFHNKQHFQSLDANLVLEEDLYPR